MRFEPGIMLASLAPAAISFFSLTGATTSQPLLAPASAAPLAAPAAEPRPASASLWSAEAVQTLESEIQASAAEGLDPAAYDAAGLQSVLTAHGEGAETDAKASQVALALAGDYSRGRIENKTRLGWYIDPETGADDRLASELKSALQQNRLHDWLRGLLPQDARYVALRDAYRLAALDPSLKQRLEVNLERWRWMPRGLGEDYIYVNVPSYSLAVVDEGRTVSTYTVVVGKPSTPTPQISAEAQSIVVNPWWNVPQSIAAHMKGGKGFVTKAGGGYAQPPGPRNALGKVKIDMPNSHSIYLHDTPSKSLFAQQSRAFSHGCIRVKDVERLATELETLDRGNDKQVRQALAGSATRTIPLQHARPVYLVYFTADVGADGKIVTYDDPYGRDRRLMEALRQPAKFATRERLKGTARNS